MKLKKLLVFPNKLLLKKYILFSKGRKSQLGVASDFKLIGKYFWCTSENYELFKYINLIPQKHNSVGDLLLIPSFFLDLCILQFIDWICWESVLEMFGVPLLTVRKDADSAI